MLSTRGIVYQGIPYGTTRWNHGEKSAIGAMVNSEGINDKIRDILVMGSQDGIPTLCEMCRTAIKRHSADKVAVLC